MHEPSAASWMPSWVGSDMLRRGLSHVAKAFLHPELELVLSLGFLASLASQPFQDCPKNLHWVDFGDIWRVLPLVAHTAWRARRTRLELEVRNEHLQGLARTELVFSMYFINEGLQPVQANYWSLRPLRPASSEAPRHSHMIVEEASSWQKQGAWQLFFHFWLTF